MKKIKGNRFDKYKIGDDIEIHQHIDSPGIWFLTCKRLNMYKVELCKVGSTEKQIARYVMLKLTTKKNEVQDLINIVNEYT